ncbi:MAG: PAS domain-containing protein [Candidatus Omnitrophota bacterium]
MSSEGKNRDELVSELEALREKIIIYENMGSVYRQAEQDLQIMARVVNSSINGVAFADLDGNLTYANVAFLGMWGYDSAADILGRPAADFWKTRDKALEVLRSLPEKGSWSGELMGKRKNGDIFDVELSVNLIKNDKGNPSLVMASFVDISHRREAEKQLRRSEEKWRSLVKNAPNIIIIADREGKIKFINHTVPGINREEPIGKELYDYMDAEYHEIAKKSLEKVFKGEESVVYENKGVGPDGRTSWYEAQVGPIKQDGQVNAAALIITDITERKKFMEELTSIFENIVDGVLLADIDEKKFYLGNKTMCQMLRYDQEEIKNLSVKDIHPDEDLPCVIDEFEKQARGEITLAKNIPVKRKDGSIFYTDVNSTPVTFNGKTYLMGIFRDITERRETEAKLTEQKELMGHINKELEEKIKDLENALSHIKRLEGLVPICAHCKKMLSENGNPKEQEAWISMEKYITERTDANFTHGLCPKCSREILDKNNRKNGENK